MIAFRDRRGRTWARRIDVDAAVRMRDLAGLDVMAVAADRAFAERLAAASPEASAEIADALYCLFLPDAERFGLSAGRFGRRLRSVRPEELRRLLFDGVGAFFRMPGPPPEEKGSADRDVTADRLWQSVYRLAGEACVSDPGPRTFGELAVMAEGRRRLEWSQTASLRADVINAAPFREGSAVHPADLDPTGGLKEEGRPSKSAAVTPQNMTGMFGALIRATRDE